MKFTVNNSDNFKYVSGLVSHSVFFFVVIIHIFSFIFMVKLLFSFESNEKIVNLLNVQFLGENINFSCNYLFFFFLFVIDMLKKNINVCRHVCMFSSVVRDPSFDILKLNNKIQVKCKKSFNNKMIFYEQK